MPDQKQSKDAQGDQKQSKDAQGEFIAYVQQRPEYYLVTQTPIYMHMLSLIASEAKSAQQLHKELPNVETADLELILDSLVSLKLVAQLCTANRVVYYATDSARELLSVYKKAQGEFGVA